ncbi:MAG: hypothetical protein KGD65_09030 [Candidatus Lokiarchaeota archaeon]|nr:hypothetical protein [Candidatus Lokiarchaeota archaeon]
MSNRIKIYTRISVRTLVIALLIISITFPAFFGNVKINPKIGYTPSEDALRSSEFTKDNYSAILTDDEYGLGMIVIDDMHFNNYSLGPINHSVNYPLLDNDLSSLALKWGVERVEFIETITAANRDNLNGTNRQSINVKLNETLKIEYDNPSQGYLIYFPHFSGATLLEFYVNDSNSITKLTEDVDYIIDSTGYLVFHYEDYFQKSIFNFTMYLIWDYHIRVSEWTLEQTEETPLVMNDIEQEFTTRFTYYFFLIGYFVPWNLEGTYPIEYIDVALTVKPPDKDSLSYQAININAVDENINDYVNQTDNSLSIELTDQFGLNNSVMVLNFTTSFNLKFEEPVGNSWAIDRLLTERNIRERIYFISVTAGPAHIFLKNVAFYDTGIPFEHAISASSQFDRTIPFFDINASVPGQLGLKIILPYVILGETCPFSIKYRAMQTLKIVVTDIIKMPLVGVRIEILHFGLTYGTFISNETVQPIDPGRTDENGQVILYNVPRGNYTARVIYQGKIVKEVEITTDKETNYVFTSVPHFPLWILVFGAINGIILLVGVIFYLKYKKFR